MFDFIGPLILGARNRHAEKWTNVLFVVAMVVFWAIGGIIKAKSRKRPAKGPEQPRQLRPTSPPMTTNAPKRPMARPAREIARSLPPSATAQKRQPKPFPRAVPSAKPRPVAVKLSPMPTDFASEPDKSPIQLDLTAKAVAALAKPATTLARKGQTDETLRRSLKLNDCDDLRIALLHYEILGRPLSLRSPQQQIIGL